MSDVAKWIGICVGGLTLLSALFMIAWNEGHKDAAIIALQSGMNDMASKIEHMSVVQESQSQMLSALQQQMSSLSEKMSITQDFHQKEIDGAIEEIKAIEAKTTAPH